MKQSKYIASLKNCHTWDGFGKKIYFLVYSREIKNSCVLLISTKLVCTLFLYKCSDKRKAIIFGSIDFRCRDFGFVSRKWSLSAVEQPPLEGIFHVHSGVHPWVVEERTHPVWAEPGFPAASVHWKGQEVARHHGIAASFESPSKY